MRKVFTFIFLVLVVSLSLPIMVHANQLVSSRSAIGIALYEQLRNDGYELSVPFDDTDPFNEAIEPLVDAILMLPEAAFDAFAYVGERLYYDVNKVRSWIKDLFGSGDTGSYAPGSFSSPITIDKIGYDEICRSYGNPSFGREFGYPLFLNHRTNTWGIPIGTNNNFFFDTVYLNFYLYRYAGDGWGFFPLSLDNNLRLYNSHLGTSYTVPSSDYYFVNTSGSTNNQLWTYYFPFYNGTLILAPDTLTREEAVQFFIDRITSGFYNMTFYLTDNATGIVYTNKKPSYTIERTKEPILNQPLYQPISYDYVTNSYGSADTIYNETVNNTTNNNNNTNNNFDIDIPFDIDINGSIDGLASLPGIFENVSSGDLSLISDDSESKAIFTDIFTGLPIEITTLFVTIFILLVVVGVINRLLG